MLFEARPHFRILKSNGRRIKNRKRPSITNKDAVLVPPQTRGCQGYEHKQQC